MLVSILILAVLLLLNAVLAMAELAVMTSRHSRLAQAARRGDKGAIAALTLAREPTRFLSTVQVGITIIGIFAGAFGENSLSSHVAGLLRQVEFLAPAADWLSLILVVLAITYASLVFGELVPKRIALARPELVSRLISRPLAVLSKITALPVRVLSISTDAILAVLRIPQPSQHDVSEDDVKSLLSRAAATGVFDPREHELMQRLFRVRELKARDLMVPRGDVVWIEDSWSMREVRVLVGTSPYSHYPVCRGGMDQVRGVVHIKDLISYGLLEDSSFDPAAVAHAPLYVPDASPALKLLEAFQDRKAHVALVVDEHGAVEGLISLNDVLRSLVGDFARLGEEEPPRIVARDDGSLLADASLPMHEFVLELGVPEEAAARVSSSTVGGLVIELLDRVPDTGDSVVWQGLRLEVVDMDRHRVDQVLVTRLAPTPEKKAEGLGGDAAI
ncbi:MAG: HlyC/CorC family transporter [Phycisphaerales bacterium]|nr:HlyC/CorC family transporter [Phycisphaerales bacterium]MCB9841395.1 HlyC/CorC family transporter [Phycisphaeraceae bacterium]